MKLTKKMARKNAFKSRNFFSIIFKLNNKDIDEIEDDAFSEFFETKETISIDLSNNNIEKITCFPKKGYNVFFLNLNNNKLKNMKGITNLIHLRYLYLSNNKIKKIEKVSSVISHLDLSHNNIKVMENVNHFHIHHLNLSHNFIEKLQDGFFFFANFDISHNRLGNFTSKMFPRYVSSSYFFCYDKTTISKLRILNLEGNNLTEKSKNDVKKFSKKGKLLSLKL